MELVKQILAHLYNYLNILLNSNKPILKIPPIPFDKLLEDDKSTASRSRRYSLLFGEDSDDEGSQETADKFDFTEEAADFLREKLKVISLPDLSSIEQAQLLALIDTIIEVESQKRSLDENGVRYVLFMRRFHHLNRIMPNVRAQGLSYRDMNWALHSDSQDLLIEYSMATSGGKFLWRDAKVHGIFLWVRNNETVRQQMEILARNHYMLKEDRDPTDCSLFYMTLRKRKLLLGLWRTANGHKEQSIMLKFLSNNFDEPRWKTAALKNAYALLGKQRYEYAAAFFLLGDRLRDAVNVCLKHLDDFQLAIAICRVYEGDEGPVLKSVFEEHVIPPAVKSGDRWLTSLAFWFLNQRDRAVKAIMVPLESICDSSKIQSPPPMSTESPDAALIVLYKQLKEKSIQTLRGASEISSEIEYFFVLRSIFAYDRMGCPLLALRLAKTWRFTPESISKNPNGILKSRRRTTILDIPLPNHDTRISSGFVNFDNWSWSYDNDNDSISSPISAGGKRTSDLFSGEPSSYFGAHNNQSLDADAADTTSGDSWGWNSPKPEVPTNQNFNSNNSNLADLFSSGGDSSSGGAKSDLLNGNMESTTLLEDTEFDDYKVDLVKRLLQHLLDAVTIVFENSNLFENNPYYDDYINRIESGLKTVCQNVKVSLSDVQESILLRCLETDSFELLKYFQSHPLNGI